MRSLQLKWDARYWTVLIILFFMAIAFIIRMIPSLFIKDTGFLYTFDSDTWYTLRQVEVMVNHFPQYDWFDPMISFPTGKNIDWGPLFPFITAALCLITGATTHSAIIYTSSLISPLMAALMVPVMYFIGKTVWDWKAGMVAGGLISIVSLIYFSITTFGLVIHHIGEMLFSSLFFLVYLYFLVSVKLQISDLKNIKSLLVPVVLASLAGILYFLALLTSTTTLLILAVIGIFTLVQNVVNHISNRPSDNLLVLNLVFLSASTILLVLFGIKQPGNSVTSYTIGLVYVNLAIIAETILLYGISAAFRGKIRSYLIFLGALSVAGVAVLQIYPPLQSINIQVMTLLFSSSPSYLSGVLNTAHLSLALAWEYFNVGLILTAGGFLVLGYHIVKNRKPEWIFILVWSAFMILITVQYQRFAYFSTVNIVLLSAICLTEPFTWKKGDGSVLSIRALLFSFSHRVITPDEHEDRYVDNLSKPSKTNKSRRTTKPSGNPEHRTDAVKMFCLGTVVILAIAFVAVSAYHDADLALNNPYREIPSSWIESLTWLKTNTPPSGVDYFQQYDASTFSYPHGAYGILAAWDAGHWIAFFSHRIPITDPFQDNLYGSSGGYAFYLSQNESHADDILGGLGGRYVITSSNLAGDNFVSLPVWANDSLDVSPYMTQLMVPSADDPFRLSMRYAYDDAYYRTMIVRLHLFDGSMQVPGLADYIQYSIRQAADQTSGGVRDVRVITKEQTLNLSQPHNDTPILMEGKNVSEQGTYANIFSGFPDVTMTNVPALEHYRLVHESTASDSTMPDIKSLKIFEYVKGAHISGNGIIEVPLRTNTGRLFVYRQASGNGEFVVPYSTSGNPYDVRATGPYHIAGTDRYVDVTETDVMDRSTVGGTP